MLLSAEEYTSRANGQVHLEDGNGLEPIAIIGIGCRFPGDATNPSRLWNLLSNGTSAWSKGPDGRYNFDGFRDPTRSSSASTNTNGGHFLSEDIAAFDASFFGLHSVEANAMDPQQRIMLEVAYEAFENAGVSTQQLSDSNTGVYVGQWTCDYGEVLSRDPELPATYHATGAGPAITSNRISYQFNLKGPSFTVDTGCSASLVALHMAVQSLRSKETTLGFVGGVNLLVDPQRFLYQSKLKMFSDDGRSFAFDHRANGYGRGEGCSGVVLKPLSAALRDGDEIRGVIRNSVLNQDGKTSGISVPSGDAQEKAIRKAYSDAGLDLWADYVEAHGTGTAVGDPIETEAIASALSKNRDASYRLPVGSVKGNIGHTESAAGLAGLIKAVLMLENGHIPPQVNFEKVNEKILLDDWRIRIPTELERRDLRRISVNSFGYGGTNAHVILDSARSILRNTQKPAITKVQHSRPRAFIISAASEKSFKSFAKHLVEYLAQKTVAFPTDPEFLDRLAYTLNRRTVYKHKVSIIAEDEASLKTQLETLLDRPIPPSVIQSRKRVAFAFSGQGAQYYNMGRELINTWPEFTASLRRASKHLASLGCPYDILVELQRDSKESNVNEPRFGQPLSTAIQLALVNQLATLNVRPAAVTGHSSGEIAAAYAAGFISFEDAMTISYHRGRLVSDLLTTLSDTPGGMIAVGASSSTAEHYIAELNSDSAAKIKVVCYNSPSSVTLAGDLAAIQELSELLESASIFNRVLRTNGAAYHSDQMRRIESDYRQALEQVKSLPGSGVVMISSLRGGEVDASEVDQEYWAENLISPVLFEDAIWEITQMRNGERLVDAIIEVGPHSQLEGPVKQTIQSLQGASKDVIYASVLKRNTNAAESFLRCLTGIHEGGIEVRLHHANCGFQSDLPGLLSDTPSYAFDHERTFWHESRLSKEFRHRKDLPHDLLGNLAPDYNQVEPRWRRYLNMKELPWLENHVVQGQVVFPAAGYLAMAVEAIRRHTKTQNANVEITGYEFHNVSIGKALVIDKDAVDHEISLSLRPEARSSLESSSSWLEFRIFTVATNRDWTEHCRGSISVHLGTTAATSQDFYTLDRDIPTITGQSVENMQDISAKKFYYLSRDIGLDWKQPFDNIKRIQMGADTSVCTLQAPDIGQTSTENGPAYVVHPGTLDAALFHGLCAVLLFKDGLKSPPVPTHIRNLYISSQHHDLPGNEMTCYAKKGDGPTTFDVVVKAGDNDSIVLSSSGITASQLPGDISEQSGSRQLCHSVRWATYNECITADTLSKICKPSVTPGSVAEQNKVLNDIVLAYINQAYQQTTLEHIPDDYRRHWYQWMSAANGPTVNGVLPSTQPSKSIDLGVAGEAISRIGPNMAGILKGEVDPLAVLNVGDLLTRIYSDERCERCYSQISAYLKEFARQNPGMKALEVGAGTGSAAMPILEALFESSDSAVSQYDFTDISPGFFESAQTKLSKYDSVMNYKVFDLMRDPAEQGFEAGTYDLVMACNVVHATPSLDDSLENIRRLLRPGGVFILMEITREELFYNLIFGSLPGWWLGSTEGRITSPLLAPSKWMDLLSAHNFERPAALLNDYEETAGGTISVFISNAIDSNPTTVALPVEIVHDPAIEQLYPALAADLHHGLPSLNVSSVDIRTPSRPGAISIIPPEVCELLASGDVPQPTFYGFKDRLLQSKIGLLITRGGTGEAGRPQSGLMPGFARSFRCENPDIRMITLDLDVDTTPEQCVETIHLLFKSPSFDLTKENNDVENEFAVRNGQLQVARITHEKEMDAYVRSALGSSEAVEAPFLEDRHLMASLAVPGLLETIRWADIDDLAPLGDDEVEVELRAASINFKDVLIAAGQLEGITEMKNDCSGVITAVGANMQSRFKKGDRVCCYYSRSYTNRPRVHGDCCAVIPESVSFETAASLPIVWATVYHSLVDRGRLARGEKVLIHSAAGAVGQAAIILAGHLGAEVFATVGSAEKKKFLMDTYGVQEDHIFSSRNTAFGTAIRAMTNGGVDVVLNSLAGDVFRETCNTVAPYGRFVEIGRKQFMDDMLMPSRFFLKNITFSYVDLALMIEETKPTVRRLLEDVIRLMGNGDIYPTTIKTMPISEIESAFRMIQAGKHIGKLILTVEESQMAKIVPKRPVAAELRSDGTYIVVGGLGGLGKAIIRWMADRGARKILTLSRSGKVDGGAQDFIDEMKSDGVSVLPRKCDVSVIDQVKDLFGEIEQSDMPLRGIIQSAMVIQATQDSLLDKMTHEQWQGATSPKIAGSWNIHTLLPKTVDFFILMSSAVALSGNPGQTNYGAACAYQDSLARYRSRLGLPAYSINVGAVVDTGFVSENPEIATALRRQGLGTITSAELLAKINYAILHPIGATPEQAQCSIGLIPAGNERGLGASTWLAESRFRQLAKSGASARASAEGSADLLGTISAAKTSDEALACVCQAILQQLSKLIATPIDYISELAKLDDYGVDSLVAVELRNWIGAYLQANISILTMRNAPSIKALAGMVAMSSKIVMVK
ncbi:putative polyketide synthase [Myriangium duriaei CBS 260.36]|uniref:Polyketide synthase n=1 Tax=Myriangium duriaei CBS 260.36 TaxID=1168546 RepID=A0A9P4JFB6_9PEZI|nr:putative polyketide synthase [Myriangium duriaei CBS 260.36]